MNEISFVEKVKKYFYFLESEYGFKIIRQDNSKMRPQTDGIVEYASDTTIVVIDSETGYAAVWFHRVKDDRKYYLDPVAIHEYLNTTSDEKKLLLSTNPQDQKTASAIFNEKFLLNQSDWKRGETTEEKLHIRLANYANWLKDHADICVKGNFSNWPKLYEYKVHRARADQLRRGEDEFVYARVKNEEGKYKLVQQSAFKDDFEYIEKLKREFSI